METRTRRRRIASRLLSWTILSVAVMAAAAVGWSLGKWQTERGSRLAFESAGAVVPEQVELELPLLDGGSLTRAALTQPVVLLDFWASWCAPCEVQSKILGPVIEEYGSRGVALVAVNMGEDEKAVRAYSAEHAFAGPVALDRDGSFSERAGVRGLPTLVALDRSGRVLFTFSGLVGTRELRGALEQALEATAATPG
jgi:thiol-disulfide isomerase/thioredoxin